jgi:hypothetical protein
MFKKNIEMDDMDFQDQGPVTRRMNDDISIVPSSKEQPPASIH